VLQTGFGSGTGFLLLGSGLESDSKKLESEHLWSEVRKTSQAPEVYRNRSVGVDSGRIFNDFRK